MLPLILGALLGGCVAHVPAPPANLDKGIQPPLRLNKTNEVAEVLSFFQRIRAMSPDNLVAEYTLTLHALAMQRTDVNRLRLALLLSLPHTSFHDDSRAAALAEETITNKVSENPELKPLALYIAAVATEQKRQEERYQMIVQKFKEEERRAGSQQRKLDALKTIEKDLINREKVNPLGVK